MQSVPTEFGRDGSGILLSGRWCGAIPTGTQSPSGHQRHVRDGPPRPDDKLPVLGKSGFVRAAWQGPFASFGLALP